MKERINLQPYQTQQLIERALETLFQEKSRFTAYTVTSLMREQNNNFEIVHDEVRRMVHLWLLGQNEWRTHRYIYSQEMWGNEWAMTYTPFVPEYHVSSHDVGRTGQIVQARIREKYEEHPWIAKNFPEITVKWKR